MGNSDPELPEEVPESGNNSSHQSDISFVLEPVDITETEKGKRTRKKRKLMVDEIKEITSSLFRQQLEDTADTLSTSEIGLSTRSMMEWKRDGEVRRLLSEPAYPVISADLQSLFIPPHRPDNARKIRAEASRHLPETPAEPEVEMHQQDQEEPDIPQPELSTDDSSSHNEDPTMMQQSSDSDHTVVHESRQLLQPQEPSDESAQSSDEQRWSNRTQKMLSTLKKMNRPGITAFNFTDLCENDKKKQISAKFYSLLVLKNRNAIRLVQEPPFSDIIIFPGPLFLTV